MTRVPLVGYAGRLTSRLLAVVLVGQAIVLSFFALVARGQAIAGGRDDDGTRLLWVGLGLAALAVVAGGLMRGPVGVTLGWVVQALTWLAAFVVPSMLFVAVVFTGLWLLFLVQGVRADASYDRQKAEAEAAEGAGPAH